METLKEMPYREKLDYVVGNIEFGKKITADFIDEHLGYDAKTKLQMKWQSGITPIPEDASFEERYETAYKNWIWIGKTDFAFIREQMGEAGIEKFERVEVEAIKRKNASPALYFLRFIRAVSPGTAFEMTAKQFAYQLQWITPYKVERLDRDVLDIDIPSCKVVEQPDAQDLCNIACQRIYPTWAAEQFNVDMKYDPQGLSCRCTITPLN